MHVLKCLWLLIKRTQNTSWWCCFCGCHKPLPSAQPPLACAVGGFLEEGLVGAKLDQVVHHSISWRCLQSPLMGIGLRWSLPQRSCCWCHYWHLDDDKQKLYSHSLITRLISLCDMTPTPHPIQRCSAGKKRIIHKDQPGSTFHGQATSARAK